MNAEIRIVRSEINIRCRNTSDSKSYSFGIGGGYNSSGGGKSANGNLSYSKSTSERGWVDSQASILGTNSVTINVGDNTNLIGSVIANSTNGKTSSDGIDGGNLTLNTNTLTYTNLKDNDEARSFGIGAGINARTGGSSGGNIKGNGSISLDYSMHDYEQNTNSVIGSGNIKTGTILNLDSDNNLISVTSGEDYAGDISRNIQTAQVITKSLTVDPIHIKETFEFGRNSTAEQVNAAQNSNQSNNSNSNASSIVDNSKDTLSYRVGSYLFGEEHPTLIGAIVNSEYVTQINPLRGFSNSLDGISTDLRNIRTELGVETQTLNVGQNRQFINIDSDGKQIGKPFTLAEYLADPSLASTKFFANGIMNNFADSSKNALQQLGGVDASGRITILFDPSSAPDAKFEDDWKGNTAGFFADLGEVSVNYLGANVLGGWIQTKGQETDQKFINAVTNNAKENGDLITLAGHSGGGLRNYLILANSNPNQFLDQNGNSVLQVKFSGTPVNNYDIVQAINNAGATREKIQNKSGDFVGNGLGANGNIIDAVWSSVNIPSLFEPEWKPNVNYFEQKAEWNKLTPDEKELVNPPKRFLPLISEHGTYD